MSAGPGDVITFDPAVFPPGAPATIAVTSGSLPALDDGNVTIDASSAGVILSGSALAGDENGLHIPSDGNVVKGLQILGFPQDGIEIFEARDNVIGGSTPAERNVIGGNGQNGVRIVGAGANNNTVSGNYIGIDAAGSAALPNGESGVSIVDGASSNTIGGSAGEGNVIFSNLDNGVTIRNSGTVNNTVAGNWIGLKPGGVRQAFPSDLAISPAYAADCTLYVATLTSGVHKSTDCGATWVEVNNGLTETGLIQVKTPPDAASAATVYTLADNGFLFATTNGGATWSRISTVLEGIDRRNLALSAQFTADQTMYAAAEWWSWGSLGGAPGVFKSTDGGVTWVRAAAGMTDVHVWKVVASPDPTVAGTLFALTQSGIEKSTDGGTSWAAATNPGGDLSDLALSPAFGADQTVFATTYAGAVYRSTDGGDSWTDLNGLSGEAQSLALSPDYATDHTVCHGDGWNYAVFCSTDSGDSWTQRTTYLPGPAYDRGSTGLAFSPNYANDGTIFVSSIAGAGRSTDGGATWVILRGLHDLGNVSGVDISDQASYNTVGPNNVIGNNNFGVSIRDDTSHHNVVAGNLIGTDPTGNAPLSNSDHAVVIWSGHHNLIGGDTAAERNVIVSAVWGDTVLLNGSGTVANTVSGNYIGTNVAGTAGIGWRDGVDIDSGATQNLIGGDTAGERNLISGNATGVMMRDPGTMNNTVSGNYIGTDVTGTVALGNTGSGVSLSGGASDNTIGGESPAERNIISGNAGGGVSIRDTGTAHNIIQGNLIGTDSSAKRPLPNGASTAADQPVEFANQLVRQAFCIPHESLVPDSSGDLGKTGFAVDSGCRGSIADNNPAGPWPAEGAPDHESVVNQESRSTRAADEATTQGGATALLAADAGSRVAVLRGEFVAGLSSKAPQSSLSNSGDGVYLANGAQDNTVGDDNIIAFNHGHGIRVQHDNTLRNTITRNGIYQNAGMGIVLQDGGNERAPRTARAGGRPASGYGQWHGLRRLHGGGVFGR